MLKEKEKLLMLIADAHKRMATNRNFQYRREQQIKVEMWLEELTKLYETTPEAWLE